MAELSKSAQAKLAKEIQADIAAKPTNWEEVDELRGWKETLVLKGVKKTFTYNEMVAKYKDICAEIEYREAVKKTLREAIEAGLLVSGKDALACEGYKIQMIHKNGSRKIDEQKLIEQGVPVETIVKATVVGKASDYVDIRAMKEEKF